MIAILSDIHANLEALEAVLLDADRYDIDAIYCLGDVIGYGPDPIPCLQHAMNWQVVLRGNHEDVALRNDDIPGWITVVHARKTILRFRSDFREHPDYLAIHEFLTNLPNYLLTTDALHVHGSPRNHINEFIFPEDIYNQQKMAALEPHFDSLCFCGHTHIPGMFQLKAGTWNYVSPVECGYEYAPLEDKLICNVGSVGQPRDGDPRACYVLFNREKIIFRRVEYDVDRTIQKMRGNDDDDCHSRRLKDGR